MQNKPSLYSRWSCALIEAAACPTACFDQANAMVGEFWVLKHQQIFKHALTPYPQQLRHMGNLKKPNCSLSAHCRCQSTNLPLPRQLLEAPLVGRTLASPRQPHSWTTWSFCSWGCCEAPSERRRHPRRGAGTRVCAGKCTLHIHPSTPQPPASGSVGENERGNHLRVLHKPPLAFRAACMFLLRKDFHSHPLFLSSFRTKIIFIAL